jgi:hypothetical protein
MPKKGYKSMQKFLWIGVLVALLSGLMWLGFIGSKPHQHEVTKDLQLNIS